MEEMNKIPEEEKNEEVIEQEKNAPPENPVPTKKPIYKKLWFWGAIVIGALALIAGAVIAIISSGIFGTKEDGDATPKDIDYMNSWLVENGELVNGTELVYTDLNTANKFTLSTDQSQNIIVTYVINNYKGYKVTVQLPLFSESKKISAEISVQKGNSSSTLTYYHTAKNFTKNSPISHGAISSYPPIEPINNADYGTTKYENGMFVFYVDESKREEYEQKIKSNAELTAQQELRENIAKELAQKALCDILNWLNQEICPLAEMDISDFGYKAY